MNNTERSRDLLRSEFLTSTQVLQQQVLFRHKIILHNKAIKKKRGMAMAI
jgi:hypothetical protein